MTVPRPITSSKHDKITWLQHACHFFSLHHEQTLTDNGCMLQISVASPCKHMVESCRSTHLTGYGAQYYAYLYAKCTAAAVWERYFTDDPFDKAAGKASIPAQTMDLPECRGT